MNPAGSLFMLYRCFFLWVLFFSLFHPAINRRNFCRTCGVGIIECQFNGLFGVVLVRNHKVGQFPVGRSATAADGSAQIKSVGLSVCINDFSRFYVTPAKVTMTDGTGVSFGRNNIGFVVRGIDAVFT